MQAGAFFNCCERGKLENSNSGKGKGVAASRKEHLEGNTGLGQANGESEET